MAQIWRQWLGAIVFYTTLPLPKTWPIELAGIARWCPGVGILLGLVLAGLNSGLVAVGMPDLVRAVVVVGAWLGLTGGLHLDGAMDTADGLAVLEPTRRLAVMADSRTGAFGVMAALIILGLKVAALSELKPVAIWPLVFVLAWGRWGQVWAIARYPYLKAEGKGSFHKTTCHFPRDFIPGFVAILLVSGFALAMNLDHWPGILGIVGVSVMISCGSGAWLNQQLGGHTGDTYGAVVEWTEAILLAGLTVPMVKLGLR